MPPANPMRVALLVFPGVEELDFIGPMEVFGAAKSLGAALTMELLAPAAPLRMAAFHGLVFEASGTISDAALPDLLILPGGAWLAGGEQGVRAATKSLPLLDYLRRCAREGVTLAAVCTGAMLLAEAGLLAGRRASTHHAARADLARYPGVIVATDRVVDDGSIVTAGGVTSGLDLALHLIERFQGRALRKRVEDYLEYPAAPADQPAGSS